MPEADLYPLVRSWIEAEFPSARSGVRAVSERKVLITATLDWLEDGGTWMRPDLALVHVHRRRFEPTATVDLYTFEVKAPGTRPLQGLHQALAHGRIGDFVVFVCPDESSVGREVEAQAGRFGVGLVTFEDPEVWTTYKVRVTPQRMSPDLDLRDLFLTKALAGRHASEVLKLIGVRAQP